jgi:hypothetical protein
MTKGWGWRGDLLVHVLLGVGSRAYGGRLAWTGERGMTDDARESFTSPLPPYALVHY